MQLNCELVNVHDLPQKDAMGVISAWFTTMRGEATPKTPKRPLHPYVESPTGDEGTNLSPEYKGEAPFQVEYRESLPRKSKDIVNLFRLEAGEDLAEGALGVAGDVGHSDRDKSGGSGEEKGEDR